MLVGFQRGGGSSEPLEPPLATGMDCKLSISGSSSFAFGTNHRGTL